MEGVGALVEVFVLEEIGQAFAPAPAGIGAEAVAGAPAVVVAGLAAHVDHAVDAAAAAQHLAARIAKAAAIEARRRLGGIEPVGARVADAVQVADRDVDPEVVVVAAGLDQQDVLVPVGAQPIGEQAPGGAGAADDVVVGGRGLGGVRRRHREPPRPGNSFTRPSDITSTARAASRMPISRVMTLMPVRPSTRAIRGERLNASQTDRPITTP